MINVNIKFKEYPTSVKMGISFLVAGWISHYFYFLKFLMSEFPVKTLYLQLGIGLSICYFVASINKWARSLCIFFNFAIIALYLLIFYMYFTDNKYDLAFITALVAILFAISNFYLIRKESSQYFKTYNETDEDGESSDN
ncbi:MAG: hypothetical protein JRG81_11270 [Deltaproteobacteria bacterium]|nr:hypothetical protein [Deltaproteobacteria bacterium]